jgi:uncharacterized protein
MTQANEIIARTEEHVRGRPSENDAGHDWWHVWRVHNLAVYIARVEGADLEVVRLAALLHDVADWKFHGGDMDAGPKAAGEWLGGLGVEPQTVRRVVDIVGGLSFRGAGVPDRMASLEGQVVQDADRLDAIGAIGIARAFAYGGHKGRPLYDPAVPPERHESFDAYRAGSGPTLNHFAEKLLLRRDRMNTPTGRQLAEERHKSLERFLEQFHREWAFAAGE